MTTNAFPIVEGVQVRPSGAVNFDMSGGGSLVYETGSTLGAQNRLVWVDRQGREEPLAADPLDYSRPDVSPDGGRVAVGSGAVIWIYDVTLDTPARLTADYATMPRWSPDGRRGAFSSNRVGGIFNIFWRAADGTGAVEQLTTSPSTQFPTSWSSDGRWLLFYESDGGVGNLGVVSLEGDPTADLLFETDADERHAAFSPDGLWIAYQSSESGRAEIYVRPFPDVDAGRWPVSTDGSRQPVWRPDGRELFYEIPAGFMAVPVETGSAFTRGTPEVLFDLGPCLFHGGRNHAVAPDGWRFLMIKPSTAIEGHSAPAQIHVVLNWVDELQSLVPVP